MDDRAALAVVGHGCHWREANQHKEPLIVVRVCECRDRSLLAATNVCPQAFVSIVEGGALAAMEAFNITNILSKVDREPEPEPERSCVAAGWRETEPLLRAPSVVWPY